MASSIRVLHVDDESGFAELVADFLKRESNRIEVVSETAATEGLDRLEAEAIDCIVSDFDMPGMDGIDFLAAVRERYPELPFILFTGKGSEEVASEAIAKGATDYLQKGSGTEQYELLANRIANAVGQYQSEKRATEQERINAILGDINQALVRASDRTEIHAGVCDRFADNGLYPFAATATVEGEELIVRACDGVEQPMCRRLLDRFVETTYGDNPTEQTLRNHDITVIDDGDAVETDRAIEAVAAVSLTHKEDVFGVFVAATSRSEGFSDSERNLLTVLSDDIAHALHTQQIQNDLRTTATRLQALLADSPDMIDIHDREGTLIDTNERFREQLGYEKEELLGMKIWDIDAELTAEKARSLWDELETGDRHRMETRYHRRDGSTFPVEVHLRRLDIAGSDRFLAESRDITTQKKRERDLKRYRDLVASVPVPIFRTTVDGEILEINEAFAHQFGAGSTREMRDHNATEIWADTDDRDALIEKTRREGAVTRELSEMQTLHGQQLWVEVTMIITEGDDRPHLVGICHDVTEREERKQELKRTERRFDALFNDSNLLVGLLDVDGTVIEANETAFEYVDGSDETVTGEPFWETPWWSDELRPAIREKVETAAAGEYVEYEADLTKPDGEAYSVTGVIRPVVDDEGEILSLIVSARDVTERIERKRLLETILENSTVPIFLKDRNGEYVLVNREFEDVFGLEGTAVEGRTDDELFSPETAREVQRNDRTVLERGEEIVVEERIPVDGEERIYLSSKVPVYDIGTEFDSETPVAVLGVAKDITERKRRERKLERQNERFDQLASAVSHDLQTPLSTALGRAELAIETGDLEEVAKAVSALERADQLRKELVNALQARDVVGETETVDLGDVAAEVWQFIEVSDEPSLRIEDSPTIDGDPDAIRRLLENLFSNSIEHGPEDVCVRIGRVDDGFYIEDDGPGIASEDREKIFTLGYSTKDGGSGVGMVSVREIALAHEWTISVAESERGGVRFEVSDVDFVDY